MNVENIKLINLLDLSYEDKLTVLSWRNDDNVRKWMCHADIISQKNHLSFIETLKDDKTKKYFLVLNEKEKIGLIYFTDIDVAKQHSEFGLYANPILKGVGKLLMEIICEYGFKKLNLNRLIAKVFWDNQKAINLYLNYNFKQYDSEVINNKKLICMELKNENR